MITAIIVKITISCCRYSLLCSRHQLNFIVAEYNAFSTSFMLQRCLVVIPTIPHAVLPVHIIFSTFMQTTVKIFLQNDFQSQTNSLLCDFKLQLGNICDIVLHPEPELCISCSVQSVLLKLFAQGFLLIHPLPVLQLCLVLKTKEVDLQDE